MLWDSDLVVLVSDLQFVVLLSENLLKIFHLVLIIKLDCKTFIAPFFACFKRAHASIFCYSGFEACVFIQFLSSISITIVFQNL